MKKQIKRSFISRLSVDAEERTYGLEQLSKSLIDDYDDTITFNLLSYINSFDNASLRKASNHFVQKLEQGNWCVRLHFDK